MSVTLSCRNVGGEPMPCGLGHHPYFPCDADTRIDAEVEHAWTIDDATLPLEKVWAEYLTLILTISFLPWELYELARKPDWFRLSLLLINLAVLWYLVWLLRRKKLLGTD